MVKRDDKSNPQFTAVQLLFFFFFFCSDYPCYQKVCCLQIGIDSSDFVKAEVRCVCEPVGRLDGHDIEPGACKRPLFKPSLLLLEVTGVTLELWKPCLPETPVLRQWLNGCFLSTTLYQHEKKTRVPLLG